MAIVKKPKMNWNDIESGVQAAKFYKLKDREILQNIAYHTKGMKTDEKRELLKNFYYGHKK